MKLRTALLSISCLTTLFGQALAAEQSFQQGRSVVTFQYLPNTEYETVIGAGYYNFKRAAVGGYINIQMTAQSTSERDDYYDFLNVGSFGDPVTGYISGFASLNFGMTRSYGENIGVFLGVGYASVEGYAEKFDPLYILDSDGTYLVRDSSSDDSGVNGNGGFILQLSRVSVELGYHSFVEQAYVGLGFSF